MREVTFEESRKIQLDILIYFDEWCKQHGLHYSLGEGTLIGAIRHKGFIPWDDDIDLLMPRKDYDKFVETYDGKYRLISLRTEKRWRSCYSRLSDDRTIVDWGNPKYNINGLWVSLLPIDNYPDEEKEWHKQKSKIHRYLKIGGIKDSCGVKRTKWFKDLLKYPLRFFFSCMSYNYIGNQMEHIITQWNNQSTKKKGSMACLWHEPWICSSDVFDEYIEMEFEGRLFSVIKGYDAYLKCQYGDYMQLPPEEKRFAKHAYKAYWKDK